MESLQQGLVGHWPFEGMLNDVSPSGLRGKTQGVVATREGAVFNGRDSHIEIEDAPALQPGEKDFSVSVRIFTDRDLDGAVGDILAKFDPLKRRGFTLSVNHTVAAPTSQANYRNIHFGTDDGTEPRRVLDCGRLGTSMMVCGLTVHEGDLYAGTFEFCRHEAGHVYRYAGGRDWVDCGCPDRSNSVASLASSDRALYVLTARFESHYSLGFSSPNTSAGGWLYRLEPEKRIWINCGRPSDMHTPHALAVFQGKLYALSSSPDEFYRYEGEGRWTILKGPGELLMSLGVYHGYLYATANYRRPDRHRLFRYDHARDAWEGCGKVKEVTQVYGQAIHEGKLHISTYPYGKVYRYDGGEVLTDVGHMGRDALDEISPQHRFWEGRWDHQVFENCVLHPKEQEIQAMAVYNGKLYAGTIPSAEVYRYDGAKDWAYVGCADGTASAYLRRAWCMAVFQGKLFVGSLPAGYVFGFEAGRVATYDRQLPAGWRHVVAQRAGGRLEIFLDGVRVAESDLSAGPAFNLSNDRPLRIGFGPHDYFLGRMKNLRIYNRALSDVEISRLNAERRDK